MAKAFDRVQLNALTVVAQATRLLSELAEHLRGPYKNSFT